MRFRAVMGLLFVFALPACGNAPQGFFTASSGGSSMGGAAGGASGAAFSATGGESAGQGGSSGDSTSHAGAPGDPVVCADGDTQCNGLQAQTCAAGQWQSAAAACANVCSNGACSGTCTPGSAQCAGLQPQQCDATGAWQDFGAACANACSAGSCTGACVPGSARCDALQPQTCTADGLWQDQSDVCANVCSAGACSGVCPPGSLHCNGLQPELCDSAGEWQATLPACASVCNEGSCLACVPGAKQCNGLQPQLCDSAGRWQSTGDPCANVCSAGVCTGVCPPTQVRCNVLQPQTCSAAGAWVNTLDACPNLCNMGVCTGSCKPGALSCNGLQPQKCDALGTPQPLGAACPFVCTKATGTCTGKCVPTTKQCEGAQPQVCDATGTWVASGSACPNVCNAATGACGGMCKPGEKSCSGAQPQLCNANGQWANAGAACSGCMACSASTFVCAPADGTPCSDNNACTTGDLCQKGVCAAGKPTVCAAPTECHAPGTCNPTSGLCSNPNADNVSCSSGVGICAAGACGMPRFASFGLNVTPVGVSGDGSTIVGQAADMSNFRWTLASGLVPLPILAKASQCSVGGISADGAFSVGSCALPNKVPVRWKGTSTPINLGLPVGFDQGVLRAVDMNGAVAVGDVSAGLGGPNAAFWTTGSIPTVLSTPPGTTSSAFATNADGSVIVGTFTPLLVSSGSQAFRFTQAGGVQLLPLLANSTSANANSVSADGVKIVGTSGQPVLWSATMTPTAAPVGTTTDGIGWAISGDGTTIVSYDEAGVAITIAGKTQLLATRLTALGVDLGTWMLLRCDALSNNGKVIVGSGLHNQQAEGFVAVLP